jgi:hypothetical protein
MARGGHTSDSDEDSRTGYGFRRLDKHVLCLGPPKVSPRDNNFIFDPGPEFVRRSSAGSYPELWERELRWVGEEKIYRLPEVLVGRVTGRDNDDQITCFRSEGTGLCRELPLDWFLQDVTN